MHGTSKGITPVIATVLLLMLAVGAVGGAFAFVQSMSSDARETVNRQQRTETNVRALECYTHIGNGDTGAFEVDIQNNGDRALDMSSVSFTVRSTDGTINYSLSHTSASFSVGSTADGIAVLRNDGWPEPDGVVRYQINASDGFRLSQDTPYTVTMQIADGGHTILQDENCEAERP